MGKLGETAYTREFLGWALHRYRRARSDHDAELVDNRKVQEVVLRALAVVADSVAVQLDRAPVGRRICESRTSWDLVAPAPDNLLTDATGVATVVIEVKSRTAPIHIRPFSALERAAGSGDIWSDHTAKDILAAARRWAVPHDGEECLSRFRWNPDPALGAQHYHDVHQADFYRTSRSWLPRGVNEPGNGGLGVVWIALLPSARQAREFVWGLESRDSWLPVGLADFATALGV